MGDLLRGEDRFAEAEAAYTRALQRLPAIDRRHWRLLYARGIAYERTKRWPQAEADLLKALELEPEQPFVLNYLGYSWVDQGLNLDRAKAMLHRAVELRPEDGFIVDSLGWAYFRLGEHDKAVTYLERAVELEPGDPVINDHLGDGYWRVGRTREARFQWQRALTFEPEPELVDRDPGASSPRACRMRRPPPAEPVIVERARGQAQPRPDPDRPAARRLPRARQRRGVRRPRRRAHRIRGRRAPGRRAKGRSRPSCPPGDGNIVHRAAMRLAAAVGVSPSVLVRLDKRLPVASGIGGGSADAAATLRGLARLWRLPPATPDLAAVALGLGSDVLVCLGSRPALMRGIGELLEPLPGLPGFDLVLVNPAPAAGDRRRVRGRPTGAVRPARGAGTGATGPGLAAAQPQRSRGAGPLAAARDRRSAGGARRAPRDAGSRACPAAARPASACSTTPPPLRRPRRASLPPVPTGGWPAARIGDAAA